MYTDWKKDADAVQLLGEELGWGHLMELAAALWAMDARKNNYPDTGCFVPTILSQIKNVSLRYEADQHREMYIQAIQAAREESAYVF